MEDSVHRENPAFLQEQIITYIGNKRALLPFLEKGVELAKKRLGKSRLSSSLDLFSGSGIVARFLKAHSEKIIANDLETYSRVVNECYLSNKSEVDFDRLNDLLADMKRRLEAPLTPGFLTELYAPRDEQNIQPEDRVFYSRENALYLDAARQLIGELPPKLGNAFLAPLLASASVHANTSGVFKGFYKADGKGQFGGRGRNALRRILGKIELELPVLSRFESEYDVRQQEALELIRELKEIDLAYLDPPYNQHPYGSNYFMLNLLAEYERPAEISRISGIPKHWNKSAYNRKTEAAAALFRVVEECPARFILISYNSEGFISEQEFTSSLQKQGSLTALETKYNTFRGSRNLKNRALHVKEFLFLLEKK